MKRVLNIRIRSSASRRQEAHGFTLIELMVSIALGLVIVAGLLLLMANNASHSNTNDRVSDLQINGRYAINELRHELLHAGNRAFTTADPDAPRAGLGALTNECLETGAAAGSFVSYLKQAVWGSNNANPYSANCIPTANVVAGEDILVIRHVADTSTTVLNSGTVYFASTYAQGEPFRGTATPTFVSTALGYFPLQTYVYYVSPFTTASTEVPLVPALYRLVLDSTGSMTRTLVASGIEHFQVQYAVLDTAGNTQYVNTLAGGSYMPAAGAALNSAWDSVAAVRIGFIARSSTPEPGYSNTTTYTIGDLTTTANDAYQRQVFSTVVQIRNHPR